MEHFYRAQQNLSSLHKIGWKPAEKNLPVFFNIRVLDLDFYGQRPDCILVLVRFQLDSGNTQTQENEEFSNVKYYLCR
jgi:hypothetical protein